MKEKMSDKINSLTNKIALSCIDSDNELMILQDTLAACLVELDENPEALLRVAKAASLAVESCGEDFIDVEAETEELQTIAESESENA